MSEKQKVCVRCHRVAGLICSRCFDSYCTIECQKADWDVHRTMCFRMPPLIPINEQLGTFFDENGNKRPVLNSPPKVPPRTPQEVPENLKKNEVGVENSKNVGVEVKKVGDGKLVGSEEVGNAEKKPVETGEIARKRENVEKPGENLKNEKISEKIKKNPEEVTKIGQNNIKITPEVSKFSQEVIKTAPKLATNTQEVEKSLNEVTKTEPEVPKSEPEVIKIKPEVTKTSQNVVKIPQKVTKPSEVTKTPVTSIKNPVKIEDIKKQDSAQKPKPPQKIAPEMETPKPMMHSDLKSSNWPTTKNVQVKILGALEENIFTFCEAGEDVEKYYEYIDKTINDYCKEQPELEYVPVLGEIVLAAFEGGWYRAHVLDPHTVGTIVQFIDYGNLSQVASNQMKPIPLDMKFDICARDFVVDNMPKELDEKQMEIISSGSITITNIHQDKNKFFHCKIFGF